MTTVNSSSVTQYSYNYSKKDHCCCNHQNNQPGNIFGQNDKLIKNTNDFINGTGQTLNADQVVEAMKSGDVNKVASSNIKYTEKGSDGKLSIDNGLQNSKKLLSALDKNNDGTVTTQEAGAIGKIADINNDGKISAGENLSFAMLQDMSKGAPDGVVSPDEVKTANALASKDPESVKSKLKQIYDGNKMGEREAKLQNPPPAQNNQYIQMFIQLISTLLKSLFGNSQSAQAS